MIGIVYAAGSKMIRRIIFPDSDVELELVHKKGLASGELMLVVKGDGITGGNALELAEVLVEQHTGKRPRDPRAVVINAQSEVVAVVCADPVLDSVPGHIIVNHEFADVGWKFVEYGSFEPPVSPINYQG